jgi:hypothetical protein
VGPPGALLAAALQWPTEGVPDRPRSWLLTVARWSKIERTMVATISWADLGCGAAKGHPSSGRTRRHGAGRL